MLAKDIKLNSQIFIHVRLHNVTLSGHVVKVPEKPFSSLNDIPDDDFFIVNVPDYGNIKLFPSGSGCSKNQKRLHVKIKRKNKIRNYPINVFSKMPEPEKLIFV